MLRRMNLRTRYLGLMKTSGILDSASRARMGVALIEPSLCKQYCYKELRFTTALVCHLGSKQTDGLILSLL